MLTEGASSALGEADAGLELSAPRATSGAWTRASERPHRLERATYGSGSGLSASRHRTPALGR